VKPGLARAIAVCLFGVWLECSGCGSTEDNGVLGTIDPGDDFVAPDLQLDSDFFFCRIQPEVLTKYSCASGGSGEMGSCHDSRSAMRLVDTKAPAPCDKAGAVVDAVPDAYQMNLDAVRFAVQSDPLSSPLYLRPLNRASHPRKIFDDDDKAAELIVEWISGATP
jgi:hypothetical protein